MWFIDEALKKNKNYYNAEITKETIPDVALSVLYGQELFSNVNVNEYLSRVLANI